MSAQKKPVGRPRANGKPHLTKHQIFTATAGLISLHGYAGTSLRMIAQQLDASPASLLNAFASKEQLLNELIEFAARSSFDFYQSLSELNLTPDIALYKSLYEETYAVAGHLEFAGLFYLPEINRSGFERAQAVRRDMLRHYEGLLRRGQEQSLFIANPVRYQAEQMFQLTETSILALPGSARPSLRAQAQASAAFGLRAVLVNPADLDHIIEQADGVHLKFNKL